MADDAHHSTPSEWADLLGRVGSVEKEIHHISREQGTQRARIDAIDRGQLNIIEKIDANTKMTKNILDAQTFTRVGTRLVLWLGALSAACASVIGLALLVAKIIKGAAPL